MKRGFTLLELVVSLAVLGLLGGIALLAWTSRQDVVPPELAELRDARARAVFEGRPVTWRSDTTTVRFYADGSSSGGEVTLASGARLTVSVLDGAIHASH